MEFVGFEIDAAAGEASGEVLDGDVFCEVGRDDAGVGQGCEGAFAAGRCGDRVVGSGDGAAVVVAGVDLLVWD